MAVSYKFVNIVFEKNHIYYDSNDIYEVLSRKVVLFRFNSSVHIYMLLILFTFSLLPSTVLKLTGICLDACFPMLTSAVMVKLLGRITIR